MSPKTFPVLLMTLNMGACITYLVHGDFRHATYWLAACVLNATITF